MQLDSTIFGEIANVLGAVPQAEGEPRRRRAPRHHVDREIMIKPYGVVNMAARTATLLNISANGVCIIDRVPTSTGTQFVLYLPRSGGSTLDVLCTVRQSKLTSSGSFRIGAEFTSEMERDARFVRGVDGVVNAPPRPIEGDTDLHQPARIRMPAGVGANEPAPAEVRSFANGIYNLLTNKSLVVGERFVLELGFQDQRTQSWTCTVLNVRLVDGNQFRVTARNDGPLPVTAQAGGFVSWLKRRF